MSPGNLSHLNIAALTLNDSNTVNKLHNDCNGHASNKAATTTIQLPDDIANASTNDLFMQRLRTYVKSLPYSVESNAHMQNILDLFITRLVQCIEAKDFDPGFLQWDSMITHWMTLKYPMPKEKRIGIIKLYYEVVTLPSIPAQVLVVAAEGLNTLTRSKTKLSIDDLRLPWKPAYNILSNELFLSRRKFEINHYPAYMGYIAESSRRFFHPAAIDEMLETFLPMMNGTNLNTILAAEYYLLTFLPQSHPQSYLPMLFRVWESVNSYNFDERMLNFLAQLAEMHVDPSVSDPGRIASLPDDARSEDEGRPTWDKSDLKHPSGPWTGIHKDVGIFTEDEWNLIMAKCISSMEIKLADTGSLPTSTSVDNQARFEIGRLPKSTWRIYSLARIIVYSMQPDGISVQRSGITTPFSPGIMTPDPGAHNLGDYLSSPLGKKPGAQKLKTYLAGSKALDSLARMIMSTESFFHPSNEGRWTKDLTAFLKFVAYEFNKRWFEEQEPDCKTPKHRRLNQEMKLELVRSLRTVVLLAIFSHDAIVVSNVQSCLKSMTVMEPGLILHPILERAIPSLEALEETQRTTASIKALGAVALAFVSREIYPLGGMHLVQILELLIPGIDLNDPTKTLCTTSFLIEISQHIQFGDLTTVDFEPQTATDTQSPAETRRIRIETPDGTKPIIRFEETANYSDDEYERTEMPIEEADAILRESTSSFADWVSNFIGRVILLLDNLPEERPDGSSRGSETEIQIIDAVAAACSQICVHLSEPLFDLVLNMVYDYASTNVRSNAVRAVHQLVECMANANPRKTLAKFMPFCLRNIQVELDHGASSKRTTSLRDPIPSDATLLWNLAILRGAMHNDGTEVVKYKEEIVKLFTLLRDKTFSKRGYSWSGKLLSSVLLTLTHTYPLENRFVNPDEWNSEDFRRNHYRYWGKLYAPEDIKMSWHVPNDEEIEFALTLFREYVEPTLDILERLIEIPSERRDDTWPNDFCRYMTVVRNAFSGTPTLVQERHTLEQFEKEYENSDTFHEAHEMNGHMELLRSCFVLTDPADPRYTYLLELRKRFGRFLISASASLRQQGETNTVDPVHILIRAIQTYALEYGDSRDSYYTQTEQYSTEIGLSRLYAKQKVWPRAVLVRRIRRYHAARLRWNTVDRLRGQLEDKLIDEIVEWSMWHYSDVRESAQSLLNQFCGTFDGVKRRCLPRFIENIAPGDENKRTNRIKGALRSLNMATFVKYALSEPTFRISFLKALFNCQSYVDPSLQDYATKLTESCLGVIFEPDAIVYDIDSSRLDRAAKNLEQILDPGLRDKELVKRIEEYRITRINAMNKSANHTVDTLLKIANTPSTHWKYAIFALRILRTLIRKDAPLSADSMKYFLKMTYEPLYSLRYYGQRAVMKSLRYVKIRTFAREPLDLAMHQNHNPLRVRVEINALSNNFNSKYLEGFRQPLDLSRAVLEPLLQDKALEGWLVWPDTISLFLAAPPGKSMFKPWDPASQDTISAVREVTLTEEFWKKLSGHFAEELDEEEEVVSADNISCVKSIFQILEEEPLEYFRPSLEKLVGEIDQNKQRAVAEMIAGVIGGSKHWPLDAQERLWGWLTPLLPKVLGSTVKSDTLLTWTSFLEYLFLGRDPRRIQPLVDYVLGNFRDCDFKTEQSFDAVKIASFTRAFYGEMGWRACAWMDDILDRYWQELDNEHEEVLSYIADALIFSSKVKWQPKPSIPRPEVFVRECRILPPEYDIMGIQGACHASRVQELVSNFKIWKEERLPGARAFQSKYDRVGVMVCKWLYYTIHDIHAASGFEYLLPLMPEIFRFSEVKDNNDLQERANILLVRMCGVIPPRSLIDPIIDAMFDATTSASWNIRMKALPLIQTFYFRQSILFSEAKVLEILEMICRCLGDEQIEVRRMAATTLTGIIRVSPRHGIKTLQTRFSCILDLNKLPATKGKHYNEVLIRRHAAILGLCALIDAFPYTVEEWMPDLLTKVLVNHTSDPTPIGSEVRKCASRFKLTHQDTWHEDVLKFSEDQLTELSTLLTGSSYYA